MKRILVATDGSEPAGRAVDLAAELAHRFAAELLLVTVEQGFLHGEMEETRWAEDATVAEILNAVSVEIMKEASRRVHRHGLTHVRRYSGLGDAAAFVLEVAEREKADLIVIGKRGRGRLSGLLLGSVSQKLVSLARSSVLVVP